MTLLSISPALLDHLWVGLLGFLSLAAARGGASRKRDAWDGDVERLATEDKRAIALSSGVVLCVMGAVSIVVWLVADRPLEGLGFRAPRWTPAAAAAILALAAGLTVDARRRLSAARRDATRERWLRETPFMPASRGELGPYAFTSLAAGFGEETAYRGFLIAYLGAFFGLAGPGLALTLGIPALFFGLAHVYQGVRGVAGTATGALIWGFVVVETGSLLPAIAFHAAWDFAMGVAGIPLMRPRPADVEAA